MPASDTAPACYLVADSAAGAPVCNYAAIRDGALMPAFRACQRKSICALRKRAPAVRIVEQTLRMIEHELSPETSHNNDYGTRPITVIYQTLV
jgi:hypothetical protein